MGSSVCVGTQCAGCKHRGKERRAALQRLDFGKKCERRRAEGEL